MANIKSQIKRNRQNETARVANKTARSEIKTRTKSTVASIEAGDKEAAIEALRITQKRIDKATASGLMKKNTAARRKSKLTKQVNELLG